MRLKSSAPADQQYLMEPAKAQRPLSSSLPILFLPDSLSRLPRVFDTCAGITLKEILRYADEGVVNKYALPHKTQKALSSQKINRIKSLSASNYSLAQIAQIMGISESTVYKYLKEKEND